MATTLAPPNRSPLRHRRQPEKTDLYRILAAHLETFLDRSDLESSGRGLPSFVKRELRVFMQCGLLTSGFIRVRCQACSREELVAFS